MSSRTNAAFPERRVISPAMLACITFVLLSLALVSLSWHIIVNTGLETGDFAANSILIQSAKHFTLTLGNYSRVGFNHPGPAIIYVLAAGEFSFHDFLMLTTPIGGQIIAVDLYNSFWIAASVLILRRIGFNIQKVYFIVSITMLLLALREAHNFDNLWFPYLYSMPFFCFVISLIGVATGDHRAWIVSAVTSGFLVNGHVSFVGVCGIPILLALVHTFTNRKSWHGPWLPVAAGVFSLFLLPLLVREMRHHPGPIEEYIGFAQQNASHGLFDGLQFIGHQIAYTGFDFTVFVFALLVIVLHWRDPLYRAVYFALGSVFLGVFYYVIKGVDFLNFDYVIIYFSSLPAFIIALAAYDAVRRSSVTVLFITGIAVAGWAACIRADTGMPDYNSPGIADLDHAMSYLGPERVALNLANNHNWGQVWSTILGVEAKRVREHRDLKFCIAENWHISFTENARCKPEDAAIRQIIVDSATASRNKNLPVLFSADDMSFFIKPEDSCLRSGSSWSVSEDSILMKDVISSGWSVPEGDFVWTLGSNSKLSVCIQKEVQAVVLDLGAFLPKSTYQQLLRIRAGNGPEVMATFDADHPKRHVMVPIEPGHSGHIVLKLDLPNAISPEHAGLSQDARVLGVSLYNVEAE